MPAYLTVTYTLPLTAPESEHEFNHSLLWPTKALMARSPKMFQLKTCSLSRGYNGGAQRVESSA
jgi:hypothetical protein